MWLGREGTSMSKHGADEQNRNGKASGVGAESGKEAAVKISVEEQNGWIGLEGRGAQRKVRKGKMSEK